MLLEPVAIYADNVKDVVADGFVTADEAVHRRGAQGRVHEYAVQ